MSQATINIQDLTPQQREELFAAMREEEKNKKTTVQRNRAAYKELAKELVPVLYERLENLSGLLSEVKTDVFESSRQLLELKLEAFGVKAGQQSHTFSSEDNSKSITLGYYVTDGWDDTVHSGIELVNKYIQSLVQDDNSAKLVAGLNRLLKRDAKGNLKSSRVIELQKWAEEINDATLSDGIDVISKSYKPVKSSWFIKVEFMDKAGKRQSLPLSIATAEFVEDMNLDFLRS